MDNRKSVAARLKSKLKQKVSVIDELTVKVAMLVISEAPSLNPNLPELNAPLLMITATPILMMMTSNHIEQIQRSEDINPKAVVELQAKCKQVFSLIAPLLSLLKSQKLAKEQLKMEGIVYEFILTLYDELTEYANLFRFKSSIPLDPDTDASILKFFSDCMQLIDYVRCNCLVRSNFDRDGDRFTIDKFKMKTPRNAGKGARHERLRFFISACIQHDYLQYALDILAWVKRNKISLSNSSNGESAYGDLFTAIRYRVMKALIFIKLNDSKSAMSQISKLLNIVITHSGERVVLIGNDELKLLQEIISAAHKQLDSDTKITIFAKIREILVLNRECYQPLMENNKTELTTLNIDITKEIDTLKLYLLESQAEFLKQDLQTLNDLTNNRINFDLVSIETKNKKIKQQIVIAIPGDFLKTFISIARKVHLIFELNDNKVFIPKIKPNDLLLLNTVMAKLVEVLPSEPLFIPLPDETKKPLGTSTTSLLLTAMPLKPAPKLSKKVPSKIDPIKTPHSSKAIKWDDEHIYGAADSTHKIYPLYSGFGSHMYVYVDTAFADYLYEVNQYAYLDLMRMCDRGSIVLDSVGRKGFIISSTPFYEEASSTNKTKKKAEKFEPSFIKGKNAAHDWRFVGHLQAVVDKDGKQQMLYVINSWVPSHHKNKPIGPRSLPAADSAGAKTPKL